MRIMFVYPVNDDAGSAQSLYGYAQVAPELGHEVVVYGREDTLRSPRPVRQVIPSMSKGVFNPVLVRPLFNHLRLVNPGIFETLAANTIPLFGQDPEYVEEIYGRQAVELVLPQQHGEEKMLDILHRPEYYGDIVNGIRQHLRQKHSYAVRLRELIDIVASEQ
jgi:hypothetical protein